MALKMMCRIGIGLSLMDENASYKSPRFILENSPLTERQASVLLWLAEGKTQREIAQILSVTYQAIEYHLRCLKKKLRANTPAEALAVCFVAGMIRGRG